MNWIVYLLISKNIKFLNHTYVGITTDLDRRLNQHNGVLNGGAKCTHAKRPYEVVYFISNILNRSDASKLEVQIKKQKGFENRLNFMKELNNNQELK